MNKESPMGRNKIALKDWFLLSDMTNHELLNFHLIWNETTRLANLFSVSSFIVDLLGGQHH